MTERLHGGCGWGGRRSFLEGSRTEGEKDGRTEGTDNLKFAADADVACTTTSLSAAAASKCH